MDGVHFGFCEQAAGSIKGTPNEFHQPSDVRQNAVRRWNAPVLPYHVGDRFLSSRFKCEGNQHDHSLLHVMRYTDAVCPEDGSAQYVLTRHTIPMFSSSCQEGYREGKSTLPKQDVYSRLPLRSR